MHNQDRLSSASARAQAVETTTPRAVVAWCLSMQTKIPSKKLLWSRGETCERQYRGKVWGESREFKEAGAAQN